MKRTEKIQLSVVCALAALIGSSVVGIWFNVTLPEFTPLEKKLALWAAAVTAVASVTLAVYAWRQSEIARIQSGIARGHAVTAQDQLGELSKTRQFDVLMKISEIFDEVNDTIERHARDLHVPKDAVASKAEELEWIKTGNKLETICLLVNVGFIDKALFLRMWSTNITDYWDSFKSIIESKRRAVGPDWWTEFEKLAEEIRARNTKKPRRSGD